MGKTLQRGGPKGFTLIELTIVLAVLVTLALILTPSLYNFIAEPRKARANNDCNTLAAAIVQFYKDTGFFPQWARSQSGGPGTSNDRLTLLITPGNVPRADLKNMGLQPWLAAGNQPGTGTLQDQLIVNGPGYLLRSPTSEFGWNGPYLSSSIGTDPWNNRYMVNIGLIDASDGAQSVTGNIKSAVWVISAGENGIIETPFNQPVTMAVIGGDDVGRRIQ